jgi:hypothetical protein
MKNFMASLFILSLLVLAAPARAQLPPVATPAPAAASPATAASANPAAPAPATAAPAPAATAAAATAADDIKKPFRGSFFLSPIEIAAIQQALAGRMLAPQTLHADSKSNIPQQRTISVAGVLYRNADDWIVWMNGQKITPSRLLPEIIDISVRDSSRVNLKWFDAGLNQVISVSLRPHQTYDITTGLLLPGTH